MTFGVYDIAVRIATYGIVKIFCFFEASHLNLALLANFMKQSEGLGDKVGRGVVSTFTTFSVTMSVFWAQILDKDCQG